jgi:hypothetical protein
MRRYFPDLATFSSSAKNADIIAVYRQLLADHLTPEDHKGVISGSVSTLICSAHVR